FFRRSISGSIASLTRSRPRHWIADERTCHSPDSRSGRTAATHPSGFPIAASASRAALCSGGSAFSRNLASRATAAGGPDPARGRRGALHLEVARFERLQEDRHRVRVADPPERLDRAGAAPRLRPLLLAGDLAQELGHLRALVAAEDLESRLPHRELRIDGRV